MKSRWIHTNRVEEIIDMTAPKIRMADATTTSAILEKNEKQDKRKAILEGSIVNHFEFLEKHMRALGVEDLVLAGYGQNPQTGEDILPIHSRLKVGKVNDAVGWVERGAKEEHRNIYLSLAVPMTDNPRGKTDDYSGVIGFVADLDNKAANEWASRCPLPPTWVIETSPGRFQCAWLVDKVVPIDKAKNIAKRLKIATGADHSTSDVIHVWRLPGLPNRPNTKKYNAGRRGEVSKLVGDYSEVVSVTELQESLADVSVSVGGVEGATEGQNLAFSLKYMSENIRTKIVDGVPLGERSEALFSVYNRLLSSGFSVDNIVSIIKEHPDGIGKKFYSDWNGDEQALRKDIKRALDSMEVAPQVKVLLEEYALMEDGSQVVGLYEHPLTAVRKLTEFKHCQANSQVQIQKVNGMGYYKKAASTLWLKHPARETIRGEMFRPGEDRIFDYHGKRYYNKFFFIHADGGVDGAGIIKDSERNKIVEPAINQIAWTLNDWQAETDILLDWLAALVQFPGRRPKWAPYIIAQTHGTGRDLIGEKIMGHAIGEQLIQKTTIKNIVGKGGSSGWGDWAVNSKLCVVSEAKDGGEKFEVNDAFRDKLNDDRAYMNLKGGKNGIYDIYCGILLFTNERNALKIPQGDRRIWAVECNRSEAERDKRLKEGGEFEYLHDVWLRNPRNGRALFEWLLARDIKTDIFKIAPTSGLKKNLIASSKSEFEQIFEEALYNLRVTDVVTPQELVDEVNKVGKERDENGYYPVNSQTPEYKALRYKHTVNLNEGNPIKCSDGNPRRMVAIRNQGKWTESSNEEARKEYEQEKVTKDDLL